MIQSKIRTIPDYPKKGIMFRDVTTLLKDPIGFQQTIDQLKHFAMTRKFDIIAGIEARGFILGAALSYALGMGFIPIRKKGKLPGETWQEEYQLEYGVDTIEIHKDAIQKGARVLIVDDLLATGGTVLGAINLVLKSGGVVDSACFIVDLPELGGGKKLQQKGIHYQALAIFDGH